MSDYALEVSNLEFRWRPRSPAVLDIAELKVRAGERVFIRGASGSGKSTLLSLVGGVLQPQRGEVNVLGNALHGLRGARRDRLRADHIGFVFQLFNLIPYLSVVENVTLPCRFSPRRRERVHGQGGAEAEAMRLLSHLDLTDPALLRRPVSELSVGQQQRVAAARALIGAPELLIADEPTSALDSDRREAFLRLLLAECQAQATTLLFVSHDAALQTHFDRVIELTTLNRAGKPGGED